MKLAVGTNFDDALFDKIKGKSVAVIYGKLTEDIIGGGRPSLALPKVDTERVKRHIELAHKHGIEFNYLLNSVCMDNLELTRDMNVQIVEFFEQLAEWKVDWVTVTIPYLIDLVKEKLPHVKISVSAFANVNSIQKAQYYEKLGVDEITLPECFNRNFNFLKELKKTISMNVRLIATNDCLVSCPYQNIHPIYQSHASQSNHVAGGYAMDYCFLKCTERKMLNPTEFIRSCWIRPEDLAAYEEIGYDNFKLTERLKKTEQIAKTVNAYAAREWDGNLAELLNTRLSQEDFVMPNYEYIDKPEFTNVPKYSNSLQLLFTNHVYIDNKRLDGFLDFFKKKDFDCQQHNCDECQYCDRVAGKVLTSDDSDKEVNKAKYEKLFQQLVNGKFFAKNDEINWSKEVLDVFEKMIQMKPEFIQEISRQNMKAEAEALAMKRNANDISIDDITRANFNTTPKEIHPMMIQGLGKLGIDVQQYM